MTMGHHSRGLGSSILAACQATSRAVLDTVFPWTCLGCQHPAGSILCSGCLGRVRWITGPLCTVCGLPLGTGPAHRCDRCAGAPPAFDRARAIAYYGSAEEGSDPLGASIRALKYSARRAIAGPLSALLAERFPFDPREFDLIVPVPLHIDRLRGRGFNQAWLLAREPIRRFDVEADARALVRVRPTSAQVGLSEAERRKNLRGAFAPRPGARVGGRRVLLIDDVATSTSTADGRARALKAAGASSVDVLTLARTLLR